MPQNQRLNFLCSVNGEETTFSVPAGLEWNIEGLKMAIKESRQALNRVDITHIVLWKVNEPVSVDPGDTFPDRFPCPMPNFSEPIVTRLNEKTRRVSDVFPTLAEGQLHILVQVKAPKRKFEVEPDTDQQQPQGNRIYPKRAKIMHNQSSPFEDAHEKYPEMFKELVDSRLPSEDILYEYHERLQGIESDPAWYSDPRNYVLLPFPHHYPNIPEGFSLSNGVFAYMGRKAFEDAYKHISSLNRYGFSKVYINGTMGYGKSYILAALACLLYREGKRVVFLPDCRAMLANPVLYIKCALLSTFANPELKRERDVIRACTSFTDISSFCHRAGTTLYFIVDQMNALDHSPNISSANYGTVMHMEQKQTGEMKMSMMGGMTNEEMEMWWKHHESKLPKFTDDLERREVEDFTGCIPLLLRPLFQFGQRDFRVVEDDFHASSEVVTVEDNIRKFASERNKMRELAYNDYLETLFKCITRGSTFENWRDSFDYRYFYSTSDRGECTCGVARRAATTLIAQKKLGKFYEPQWINTLYHYKNNPSALGFQVDQICLSSIADMGLHFGTVHIKPMVPTWFTGNLDDLLNSIPGQLESDLSQLYFPSNPRFKDIDAAYVEYDGKSNRLLVVPIQITISKRQKDSERLFYQKWNMWEKKFSGYDLSTTFLWIVEDDMSWKTIIEKELEKRRGESSSCAVIMPEYKRAYVSALEVHVPLGRELKRIRSMEY